MDGLTPRPRSWSSTAPTTSRTTPSSASSATSTRPGPRELVARYFDSIPPGFDSPIPPRPAFKRENDARRPGRSGSLAGSAGFHMGFRFFLSSRARRTASRILEYILLEGETSRLRNRLLQRDLTARYLTGGARRAAERRRPEGLLPRQRTPVMVERVREGHPLGDRQAAGRTPSPRTSSAGPGAAIKEDYLERLSTNLGRARCPSSTPVLRQGASPALERRAGRRTWALRPRP
ncbi:MAG: hypothetical protein MZV70_66790 [Desulfobacterales bacterium]|nr:hypothetical protein [Desulfobacterales bacterium]